MALYFRALDHARTAEALGHGEHSALVGAHVYVSEAVIRTARLGRRHPEDAALAWQSARQAVAMLPEGDRQDFRRAWADAPPTASLAALCGAIADLEDDDDESGALVSALVPQEADEAALAALDVELDLMALAEEGA